VASLALSDDDLRRLAEELAPLIAAAMPSREAAPTGWLDAKAAAAYAGCTPNALHKATAAREIRFTQDQPGGKTWFKAEWIDQWRGL
jgi:hypothetical protein